VLTLNPNWYGGKMSSIKTIPLINIPKTNAIMTSLSIGEINYVYSDSGSGETTATTNTDTAPVNLNRLVFIGINSQRAHLNNSHFRRALLLSIDRSTLVSQYYSSHAEGCVLPFNPSWSKLSAPTSKELSSDFTTAASEMKLAGGTGGNTSLTLLVNSDNSVRTAAARYIASCFSKAGISVKVHAVSYPTYNMLIQKKTFDLYIGEIKISNDMNISPLLTNGSYGTLSNSTTLTAYNSWRSGNGSITSVAKAFKNETPFIPICYRSGTTSYTKGISGVKATDGDIFFDFQNWSQK
jgi:peptide/nickel transport system substrate-binding protein